MLTVRNKKTNQLKYKDNSLISFREQSVQSACFFFRIFCQWSPLDNKHGGFFSRDTLPFGNSHDLIMVFEKLLILVIPQSYLDILRSVCKMSPKIISSATVYREMICWRQRRYHYITQSVHWNAHSNLCTISVIYEPSGFAFQPHMRVIPVQWKDDWGWTPFLVIFFFFHASDSSENVPVHHSRACGASEGGTRGGEIMRAHIGCKEFRDSCSVGALPLYPPALVLRRAKDTTLTTGTHPPVTTDSQSKKAREGCDCTSAAFWVIGTA